MQDCNQLVFGNENNFKSKNIFKTVRRDNFTSKAPKLDAKGIRFYKRQNYFATITFKRSNDNMLLFLMKTITYYYSLRL